MIPLPKREHIFALHKQGLSIRRISKETKVARSTIKRLLNQQATSKETKKHPLLEKHEDLIRQTFAQCQGNAVRVHEVLVHNHQINIPYSTLTRLLREARLREAKKPVGNYQFLPGEEMQFDTSPHRVKFDDGEKVMQCAALVLAYSRRLFVVYYHGFKRFDAKAFLAEALAFMDGSCRKCLIDNTSVVLAGGAGSTARPSPEMEDFARAYGFHFGAHEVGNPQRKGRVERPFHYIENNFLAGRCFRDYDDLNQQALDWCRKTANLKEKRALGMAPEAAYVFEKQALIPLPVAVPPVYDLHVRQVDNTGHINLETHRYSVPSRLIGKQVEVYKYPRRIVICFRSQEITEHQRIIGCKHSRSTHKEHRDSLLTSMSKNEPSPQEAALLGQHDLLDSFAAELKKRSPGRGANAFKRLLYLQRTYPETAFLAALKQAHHYGLFNMRRLENLILDHVAGNFFHLDLEEDS